VPPPAAVPQPAAVLPPASVPPPPAAAAPVQPEATLASAPAPEVAARPAARSFTKEEEPTTARGQIPDEVMKKATPAPADVLEAPAKVNPLQRPRTDSEIEASELPTMEFVPPGRAPSASQADVDALIADFGVSEGGEQQHARELKKIAGLEPTPPPPAEIAKRLETREFLQASPPRRESARPPEVAEGRSGRDSGISGLLALSEEPGAGQASVPTPAPRPAPLPAARAKAPSLSSERQLPTQPSKLKQMRSSLPSVPTQRRPRGSGLIWVLALVFIAGGGYLVWSMRATLLGPRAPAASAAVPSSSVPAGAPLPCNQVLVVTDVPAHAEVLLRKGQAPIDVEKMPVGARLEFVATAEGFAPKRVVVPLGATWDPGSDGKPRYEAAVQLDKSRAPHGTNDPWPPGEPGSAVGGQGPPGTVHVVATPRGAEVWMLAGLGPEARIEQQLACDQDLDVLVAGPTTFRKRLHVAASDFVPEELPPDAPPGKTPKRVARVSGK
jgi:hypothetical protein